MPYRYTYRIKEKITEKVDARIREVFVLFPEFDGQEITIGIITTRKYGTAEVGGNKINLKVGRIHPFKKTIAHELMHLLQDRDGYDVPQGERSCDLFVCARSPELLDDKPEYLKIPFSRDELSCGFTRNMIHMTAKKALKLREQGNRRYIKWFENEINQMYQR